LTGISFVYTACRHIALKHIADDALIVITHYQASLPVSVSLHYVSAVDSLFIDVSNMEEQGF